MCSGTEGPREQSPGGFLVTLISACLLIMPYNDVAYCAMQDCRSNCKPRCMMDSSCQWSPVLHASVKNERFRLLSAVVPG